MINELVFLFIIAFTVLFLLRKIAKKFGLVDAPNVRKVHSGSIPLVGGIAIFLTFSSFLFLNPFYLAESKAYLLSMFILVFVGVLDDKFDVAYELRFAVQTMLSFVMMIIADIQLHTIGDIFGFGEINLGILGYLVTVIAVIAAINTFNMIDGIDGLLGGVSIVTFAALGLILSLDGQNNIAYLCLVLIVILLPYVLMNLGFLGRKRKVFMGDAGSMFIGFTVIWFLLLSSQNGHDAPLRPVTALWLIALPLMDMATIMIRRIKSGNSPFKPDREHLHHIIQRLGFKPSHTLMIICGISILFAGIGIIGEIYIIEESYMFYAFITCFIAYYSLVNKASIVTVNNSMVSGSVEAN
ncbi:UDP-N-acetylglucosamine--undecaprenyl-phosphate N-acetylglucosaminephosphotransferase [Marinomonas sp. MED121]|uniref:UDP-N-acetylglucosamine--undecaprenyl-phosphate N-acetylglucosaminephosphotransferase n=1 Tax=Marinomonas sp. MED121 TaxID=314277 RepID=UPI00055B9984|nr:UDP-N-acetylglucosamine--undecaprenyl-phosphate N-acetylglucosaminephosphotransferase [Marinomonas sp. MED121]